VLLLEGQAKTASDLSAEFVELRRGLELFFKIRGAPTPEELADETLFRVWMRVQQGNVVTNLQAYALGVARRVLFEERKKLASELEKKERYRTSPAPDQWPSERETQLEALGLALKALPAKDREIVQRYYAYSGEQKVQSHRELAKVLGITQSSLKIRLYRIRQRLRQELARQLQKMENEGRR
jgi:RNA polymerase sigma factor (sigma-70 family)